MVGCGHIIMSRPMLNIGSQVISKYKREYGGVLMGMKEDAISFNSKRTVKEIGQILQNVFGQLKASSIEQIDSGSGALDQFSDRADIQVVAQGVDFMNMWAVQVYVVDDGDTRLVELVALGDGGFTRVMAGSRNTTSISKSIKKRDAVAEALR